MYTYQQAHPDQQFHSGHMVRDHRKGPEWQAGGYYTRRKDGGEYEIPETAENFPLPGSDGSPAGKSTEAQHSLFGKE